MPVVSCFFEAMTFLEDFFRKDLVVKNLSIRTQISMKALVCGEDFSPRAIGRSINTISELME